MVRLLYHSPHSPAEPTVQYHCTVVATTFSAVRYHPTGAMSDYARHNNYASAGLSEETQTYDILSAPSCCRLNPAGLGSFPHLTHFVCSLAVREREGGRKQCIFTGEAPLALAFSASVWSALP